MKITIKQARKVLETVDAGLVRGLGNPALGQMCVEAAVCYALGEKHGDTPSCVSPAVQSFKVILNDAAWSSDIARTKGLRKLAIAQLGTKDTIDEAAFAALLAKLTIQRVLPPILRKVGLNSHADACESQGTVEAAESAATDASAASAAYAATYAARADASAAYAATYAATYAARADASAASAAYAATYAARADASAASAAYAATYAARADAATYAARAAAFRDEILTISANCCLDALREVGAPGIALLDILIPA